MSAKEILTKKVTLNGYTRRVLVWLTIGGILFAGVKTFVLAYDDIDRNKKDIECVTTEIKKEVSRLDGKIEVEAKRLDGRIDDLNERRESNEEKMIALQKDVESIKQTVGKSDRKMDRLDGKLDKIIDKLMN